MTVCVGKSMLSDCGLLCLEQTAAMTVSTDTGANATLHGANVHMATLAINTPYRMTADPWHLTSLRNRVYCVPCSYVQVNTGTMKRISCTCIGEHSRCCHLHQPEKSTVAEHALVNVDHCALFEDCLLYTSRCV